jgi:membrane-bound lytic murein transglycosylase F
MQCVSHCMPFSFPMPRPPPLLSLKTNTFRLFMQELLYFCIQMFSYKKYALLFVVLMLMFGCMPSKRQEMTPWGESLNGDSADCATTFSINDILSSGEMIMLTLNGPSTYFAYHGKSMGTQFLLCEKFAQRLGVALRVDVCKDTLEMLTKLKAGEGDVIAVPLPRKKVKGIKYCSFACNEQGGEWAVNSDCAELADSLNHWFTPTLLTSIKQEERALFSTGGVHRRTYAPMLHADRGIISSYDQLFMRYAPLARWDWRLMAAQCYQESTFDPRAYSWAGAKGLMQIMPATAAELGLAQSDIYEPEPNIHAAARYIAKLNGRFQDIRNPQERQLFVLASYNGGHFHIRDAMALTKKNGRNPYHWNDVAEYVLKLEMPQFYRDPIVKYGYMRGSETVNYVSRIYDRWMKYRGVARGCAPSIGNTAPEMYVPQKAQKRRKYKL